MSKLALRSPFAPWMFGASAPPPSNFVDAPKPPAGDPKIPQPTQGLPAADVIVGFTSAFPPIETHLSAVNRNYIRDWKFSTDNRNRPRNATWNNKAYTELGAASGGTRNFRLDLCQAYNQFDRPVGSGWIPGFFIGRLSPRREIIGWVPMLKDSYKLTVMEFMTGSKHGYLLVHHGIFTAPRGGIVKDIWDNGNTSRYMKTLWHYGGSTAQPAASAHQIAMTCFQDAARTKAPSSLAIDQGWRWRLWLVGDDLVCELVDTQTSQLLQGSRYWSLTFAPRTPPAPADAYRDDGGPFLLDQTFL